MGAFFAQLISQWFLEMSSFPLLWWQQVMTGCMLKGFRIAPTGCLLCQPSVSVTMKWNGRQWKPETKYIDDFHCKLPKVIIIESLLHPWNTAPSQYPPTSLSRQHNKIHHTIHARQHNTKNLIRSIPVH